MAIKVFHRDNPDRLLPMISKDARLVVWKGVGSDTANMNYVVLESGEANTPHSHSDSEDTIHILEGRGSVIDLDSDKVLDFEAGDTVHVPIGVRHAVRADRDSKIVSVGGPSPADMYLLKAIDGG
jgi:quercetin dioxygenase-like cupin family protein